MFSKRCHLVIRAELLARVERRTEQAPDDCNSTSGTITLSFNSGRTPLWRGSWCTEVVPRPTVEAITPALVTPGPVRDDRQTLVNRSPQFAGLRVNRDSEQDCGCLSHTFRSCRPVCTRGCARGDLQPAASSTAIIRFWAIEIEFFCRLFENATSRVELIPPPPIQLHRTVPATTSFSHTPSSHRSDGIAHNLIGVGDVEWHCGLSPSG